MYSYFLTRVNCSYLGGGTKTEQHVGAEIDIYFRRQELMASRTISSTIQIPCGNILSFSIKHFKRPVLNNSSSLLTAAKRHVHLLYVSPGKTCMAVKGLHTSNKPLIHSLHSASRPILSMWPSRYQLNLSRGNSTGPNQPDMHQKWILNEFSLMQSACLS